MKNVLKNKWLELASNYCDDNLLTQSYWEEIEHQYDSKSRHYHKLTHISKMLEQAEIHKENIQHSDIVLFAIWYHDIIYKSTKSNNEEKSSELALKRLSLFSLDEEDLKSIETLILSTKKHQPLLTENTDNRFLLDFDLSILGTDWETYNDYISNIRKEYAIYPDFVYNNGRKKVLKHFLDRQTLYFTDYYQKRYESQARENLKREIELL